MAPVLHRGFFMRQLFTTIVLFFILCYGYSRNDTTLFYPFRTTKIQVDIKYPKKELKGTILLLHGYNLPHMQWCEKTSFCKLALEKGYVLIIPNFLKTTYQEKFYPETNPLYTIYPTRKWIRDTVITSLQKEMKLLQPGANNFVLGLSTGGRGAALLGLDLPDVFKAAACLSGDFDHYQLPFEKIYHNYYGKFSVHKNRWKTDDNLHAMIKGWKIPVYLAHGKLDKVCPVSQTINFHSLLKKTYPQLDVKLAIVEKAQHDYAFWGSQSVPVLAFFDKFLK